MERLCDFDQSTSNLVVDRISEQSSVDELRELLGSYDNLKKTLKQYGAKIEERVEEEQPKEEPSIKQEGP